MCGIVGIFSNTNSKVGDLLNALKRLEYRGYDSFGVATDNGIFIKKVGDLDKNKDILEKIKNVPFRIGIAHTRWATHGKVCEENAHPHPDCNHNIFIVHNGTIENYKELRKELESKGHIFRSATDSEIFSHYIEEKVKEGKSIKEAILDIFEDFDGTYAIVILDKINKKLYGVRKGSPLVMGMDSGKTYLASDVYAFLDKTNNIIILDDYEFVEIDRDSVKIFDKEGKVVRKTTKKIRRITFEVKKNFEHYMIKEIHEQPHAGKVLLNSLSSDQLDVFEDFVSEIENSNRVIFLASGSSHNSSCIAAYLLREIGIDAVSVQASEYMSLGKLWKDSTVIAVSQSGETMDVILPLKSLRNFVKKIIGVVNVPYSTIQRMSDLSIEIRAGFEKAVAATKTYFNQVLLFLKVAEELGLKIKTEDIPTNTQKIINTYENKVFEMSKKLKEYEHIFVIGRYINYEATKEIALKLKEIPYIHAEAIPAGELKHGPIALIDERVPVIALSPDYDKYTRTNIEEIKSRSGIVIDISNINSCEFNVGGNLYTFPLYSVIIGQLFSYYIAKHKGLPIDKPRNLAKSVTVV